jgi:hypothetical protein
MLRKDTNMSPDKSITDQAAAAARPPFTVWLLVPLMIVMALISVAGAFIFAFPTGELIYYIVGTLLIVACIGYAIIIWRLRRGERAIWTAALILPIVHTLVLNVLDLVQFGAIPSENYPFIGITLAIVVLLLLPATRNFFGK